MTESTAPHPVSIFRAAEFELIGIGLSVGPKKFDPCASFEVTETAIDYRSEDTRAFVEPDQHQENRRVRATCSVLRERYDDTGPRCGPPFEGSTYSKRAYWLGIELIS